MLFENDENSQNLRASAERFRRNRRLRWYGILVVLCAMLLATRPEGQAQSLHLSGGIIAAEPAKPTPVVPSPAKKVGPDTQKKNDTRKNAVATEKDEPPSSRQTKDAPLQAAPDIREESDTQQPAEKPSEEGAQEPSQVLDEAPADKSAKQEQSAKPDRPKLRTGPAPKAPPPSGLRLFGTVEFKGPLKNITSWQGVLQRNEKQSIFIPEKKLGSVVWRDLKAKLEKLSLMEQLQTVNRFWNQWPYLQDPELYKKPDYWAIPAEFVKNSGDCEDYAIVKYFTLKELGVDPTLMRIVVLMETVRNIAHAVLVVYINGDAFVLDNLSNNVLSHTRYRNYLPQFSVNESFRWAHVRPK